MLITINSISARVFIITPIIADSRGAITIAESHSRHALTLKYHFSS